MKYRNLYNAKKDKFYKLICLTKQFNIFFNYEKDLFPFNFCGYIQFSFNKSIQSRFVF